MPYEEVEKTGDWKEDSTPILDPFADLKINSI
jgi:hypothetical protein